METAPYVMGEKSFGLGERSSGGGRALLGKGVMGLEKQVEFPREEKGSHCNTCAWWSLTGGGRSRAELRADQEGWKGGAAGLEVVEGEEPEAGSQSVHASGKQ